MNSNQISIITDILFLPNDKKTSKNYLSEIWIFIDFLQNRGDLAILGYFIIVECNLFFIEFLYLNWKFKGFINLIL